MTIDIQLLHEKYMSLEIPNPFSMEQIHSRLTQKYYAEKVDLSFFADLSRDPHANFDKATAAYVFEDERGTKELLQLNNVEEQHEGMEIAWIINSTMRGMAHQLILETDVFYGMDNEEMYLGNPRYEEFLVTLYLTGYIQFENDSLIDQLRAQYRDGYRLRYFGMQNGAEKYLYK
ncbi:pyruvate kinase [Paenibacillus sp. FSL H8-0079]|uniref:pyruvate kinase n=1 Tax=Paenibacillus sp. FSL H8-0079 TaxID=2921375 RepID=UPI0030EF4E39